MYPESITIKRQFGSYFSSKDKANYVQFNSTMHTLDKMIHL